MTLNAEGYRAEAIAVPRLGAGGLAAFRQAVAAEVAADRPIYAFGALYLVAVIGLALWLGSEDKLVFFMYLAIWLAGVAAVTLLYFVVRNLPAAVRQSPDRPLSALVALIAAEVTPRGVAGAFIVAFQALLMGVFTSAKNLLTDLSGYVWDRPLAALDAFIHGGVDPWHLFAPILTHPWLLHIVEHLYLTGWMTMLVGVPAVVAMTRAGAPIRMRVFVTYILAWIVVGNVLAGVFMSAGPAYFGDITGDFDRYRPLLDHIAANAGLTHSAWDIQRALWNAYASGHVAFGSGISAFPSMHVAMATLWVIVGFQFSRRLGYAALAFLVFIQCGSVILGWHYAIDGYASILIVLALWAIVGWALRVWPGAIRQSLTASS
jgi:hypothetical protein